MRQLAVCLILLVANASPVHNQALPASHSRAIETALDRYVAAPDSHFIAYTWNKFLTTADDRWPARLPMTKSAVRAIDAVTGFMASPAGGRVKVSRFVASGASKRGWTTWTTAAVDTRVIAPAVIDLLSLEPSFLHHWRAYGVGVRRPGLRRSRHHGVDGHAAVPRPAPDRGAVRVPHEVDAEDAAERGGRRVPFPGFSRFYPGARSGETLRRYVPVTAPRP